MDFENTDVESNTDFEQEPLDDAALSFSDEAVNSQTNAYNDGIDGSLASLSVDFAADDNYARSANIENALATDPVKFGKAKRIAERRGSDVGLVFDNFEEFEARDKQLLLDDIVKKNPALKELAATSPEFMTLAANDCDKLQEISNNLTIFGTMNEPIAPVAIAKKAAYLYNENERRLDVYEEIGDLMTQNDPESQARLAILVDEANKASLIDTSGLVDTPYNAVEQLPYMKRTMLPKITATVAGAAIDAAASSKAGAASGAAVGSVVPGAGTAAGAAVGSSVGAVVGTIKGAAVGNAVGTGIAMKNTYDVETGSMYANLAVIKDENGQNFESEDMVAVSRAYGALSAAVELLPMETMARLVPGYDVAKKGMLKAGLKKSVQEALKNKTKTEAIRGILKDVSFAAGAEGVEESVQELLQIIGERHLQDEYNDKTGYNFEKNDWGDDAERIGSAGYQGVKASLLLPVLGGAGRAYVETRAVNEMQAINSLQRGDEAKAQLDNSRMDNMQNTIQQLGELKENPEQVQAFLQRAARNSDMRDIYMSVEDAKAVLASDAVKKNMDAMKKLGVMDSIERQLANSADTGAAVKIAFEDYGATVMSRQELYGAFKDIVKTYEDGVTMNELRQHQKTVENVVKEGQKLKEQNKADFDYIYDRILENARVSGIPSEQSKLAAEQNTYFYLGLARMHNLSAVQMFQQDGLNFDYKIDNSPARSAQLDKIIEVIRDEQLKGADQNLLRASRVVARKDINEIKKTLNRKIENPNTADVKEYLRVLNAISDMKINLENMTTEDLAAQLQAYAAQSPVMVDIKRSDADRVKSGIFSSSEKALADIQAQGAAGDYVLVGGGRVPVDYEIVELSDMITSHNTEGAVNETYPQELQPRDRSRSASDAQINEIVNSFAPERVAKAPTATEGAPIITKQGYVAVGNGRALALGKVYENVAKAEQYRQYLIEQGYNVEGYAEPVLVRRLAVDLDVKQLLALVDDANTSGTMQYSDAEKAITYSKKLTGEIIDLLDTDAELMSAANRRFIREFFANVIPTAERNSFLDKDDKVTRKGIEMIENTLTAIIVPDARFLSVLVENPDNNIRKITAGLAKSAPAIVSFENDVQSGLIDAKYSLATDIRQAVEVLKRAKDKGQKLDLYVKQLDLLEGSLPAEVLAVAEMFDKSHSAIDFADKIKSYIHNASAQGDLSQGNMFGMEPVAKIVLLERMNVQSGLFQGNIVDENGGVALKIVTKEEMQGLSDDDFKHKMLDTLKSLKGKKIFNKSLNGDVEIRTSSIKKYKSFFADNNKKLIVPYIPELLGKAKFERIEEPYNKRETSIKAYYKADLPIAIDNDVYNAALTVREDQYGDFFWDAQIKEKPQKTTPATNPGGLRLKADKSAYEDSIILDKKKVNNTLYQITDTKRGAYSRENNISLITLFEKADASTIIHESAHFFLDDMRRFNYSAETQSQLEAIYKYVGSLDGRLSREQNEYFARSFEAYLTDGRSPNNLLNKVFARFKNWLSKIYKTVKNLDVDLDDNIRKAFDEMLGGRGIDYTMQVSGAKMLENLNEGTISTNSVNKAMELLKQGKMSRSDMEELISKLKTGELKRANFKAELNKFEESNNIHHEQISSMSLNFYKRQLEYGNFSKSDVKNKILRLVGFTKPRTNGGKLVGRFSDIKVNQAFDNIRAKLETPKDKALEEMKINMEMIESITKGQTEGNVQELSWNNKLLSIAAEKASAKILVDVYNAISDTYNSGRLSNEVTGEIKKIHRKRLINEVLGVLGQGDGADWRKEVPTFKKVMRNFGRSIYGWNGVLDILSMFDKSSKVGNSKINQNLSVFDEEIKMRKLVADDGERLSNLISEALGGAGNKAISVSRYINKELSKKFELEWGNNHRTYTKDELIDIYMKAKDHETKQMMLSDKILQFNETFLAKVDALLTEEDIAVANSLFKFYNETYDKLNEFYEDHYGVSLGKREFYSPRSMDKGGIDVMNGDLKSYAGLSATKVRTAKAGPIKVRGAMAVVNNYIANSNHYMAFADKLQDINAALGDAEVRNVIRSLFGEDMNKKIGYEIGRFASNDKVFSQGVSKWLSIIRSNYAVSALAAKPSITIKQLTSFPAYWEHLSSKEFMDGIIDFAKNPKKAMEILGNSTLMKTRGVNIIRDFEIVSNNERLKNLGTKTGFREFLMMNVQLGDRGAIYLGGWAVYKKVLKETQSHEKALAAFEKITNETQQSSYMSEQSAMQSNPFMAMFTMFQSSQNQYLRKEITAIRGLLTGRIDKEKAMKTLFIYHFLLPMLFQFVSDGFRWDKDAQLRTAVIGSLNGAFILGDIIEKLADLVITQKKPKATRARDMIPFWGTGEDSLDFLYKSIQFANDDIYLEDYIEAMQKFGKSTGELSGLPVKYGLDVVNNLGEYVDDEEYGRAGLLSLGWSPYALRDLDEE